MVTLTHSYELLTTLINMTTLEKLELLITTLSTEFKDHRSKVELSLNDLLTKIEGVAERVSTNEAAVKEHEDKITTNIEDIKANKFELDELKNNVKLLQEDNERLAKSLDDQIDRNMRETLIFSGIAGGDTKWEETKKNLAKTLTNLEKKKVEKEEDRYSYDDFFYGIVRAHRGGKGRKDENKIYAKFSSQQLVDHIKTLSLVNRDIFINQMHSPMVNERLFNGRKLIKTLKGAAASKSWKMHMNDRCQLMCKKPGEERYVMYKQF